MDQLQQKLFLLRKKLIDKGLYDVRLVVLGFVGLIAISVFWNGAKIVQQNYELEQKVAEIEDENELLELENRNKQLQNEYLKTNEFAELTARRVFGRAAAGERVYIVPQEVALSALDTEPAETAEPEVVEKPQYQKNVEAWLSIYLGS